MNTFKQHLIDNGMNSKSAIGYVKVVNPFLGWCKLNGLNVIRIKRSDVTDYLQLCRESGNKEITIRNKERGIKKYYEFLGTKHNPGINWIKRTKEYTLPPKALSKQELMNIYLSLKPHSPVGYRNRCILGMVVFQGILQNELWELRINDIDFNGTVFIEGQLKTNSRTLKLEAVQMMHLYEYFQKYRKEFLINKENKETDRFFLSMGAGERLTNVTAKILKEVRLNHPQVIDLKHIRGSVITHWEKQEGIIEAMVKAGHRYVTSTARYQTHKYDELQERLKNLHPLERMVLHENK